MQQLYFMADQRENALIYAVIADHDLAPTFGLAPKRVVWILQAIYVCFSYDSLLFPCDMCRLHFYWHQL